MQKAKLYGIGVGTGSPDLMTLRAVHILNNVDVIAIPQSAKYRKSVAWRIAEPNLIKAKKNEAEKLFLHFPMTKDPKIIQPAWEIVLEEIGQRLQQKKSIAFLTEGDPLFYSTYIYLHKQVKFKWPQVEIEVVPAISSFTAVPSVIQMPIADGKEKVAVLPASYGLSELPNILKLFDTILLMKVSSVMPELVSLLEKENYLDKAVYVTKATMPEQNIITDLKSIQNDKCDYFSMVVIRKTGNEGFLFGQS